MTSFDDGQLAEALRAVLRFRGESQTFRHRIAAVENGVVGEDADGAIDRAFLEGMTGDVLKGSLLVKAASAQIDVVVHAAGIVASLPYILGPDERIKYVSLGAGNTGKAHDLETDLRVAEFKFIKWQGGAESVRQDSLLVDLFHLATSQTSKQRFLYVTGKSIPMAFLEGSKRNVRAALARRPGVPGQFDQIYGDWDPTVKDYWASIQEQVEICDLAGLVPELSSEDWGA